MPNALRRRAAPSIAACASSIAALITSIAACGPSPIVVERPPAEPEPALLPPAEPSASGNDRPPAQVAVDPPAESPQVARNTCDLEPRIAALGRGCQRIGGVAAFGTGAEPAAVSAFDGDACSIWNSGGFAPQAATLDLGAPTLVSTVLLVPEMTPSSATVTHVLEVSDDGRSFQRLGQLRAPMRTGEIVELPIPGGVTTRFVRVSTSESPSWVAWRDIAVLRWRR